jgi:predicted metal-dependent hydrolase
MGEGAVGEEGRVRDRDAGGKARNARPRDAYGRPLTHGAQGEPTMPDDLDLAPADALEQAQRLLDADRPFHAHEVLESVWKAAPDEERELWRGLAQVAVGLTHVRRGNARGARALLTRAADRLEPFANAQPHGLDLNTLVREVRAIIGRLDAGHLRTDMELPVHLAAPSG